MAEGIPEGLVTNTEAIAGDIQGVDRITVEDLAHLWRVYTTNKNLLANHVGQRLENFFWRIWSNGRIRESIRGSNVAALFNAISDGDTIIRTTPTSSPRSSRLLPTLPREDRSRTPTPRTPRPTSSAEPTASGDAEEKSEDEETVTYDHSNVSTTSPQALTVEEEKGRRRGSSRPPPILKKTGPESTKQESKTARIVTPTWKTPRPASSKNEASPRAMSSISFDLSSKRERGSDTALPDRDKSSVYDIGSSSSTIGQASSSLTRNMPSDNSKDIAGSAGKSGKKKSAFIASSASSKRRPTVMRRKSSQSSSSNANTQPSSSNTSKAPSPRLEQRISPFTSIPSGLTPLPLTSGRHESSRRAFDNPEGSGASKSTEDTSPTRPNLPTSRSASPLSKTAFHRPTRDHLPNAPIPPPESQIVNKGKQDWIVDSDFRSKFAEKFRPENLPFAVRASSRSMSTVALSTSHEAGGLMASGPYNPKTDKGKGKAKQPATTEQRVASKATYGDSSAIDDDDDEGDEEDMLHLPRTKSQLTLLLKKDKRIEDEKNNRKGRSKRGKGS